MPEDLAEASGEDLGSPEPGNGRTGASLASSAGSQVHPPGPPGNTNGTNVAVVGGGQQPGNQQSGTAADQKTPPTFSPRDGNNPMLVVVKSIYNILGS